MDDTALLRLFEWEVSPSCMCEGCRRFREIENLERAVATMLADLPQHTVHFRAVRVAGEGGKGGKGGGTAHGNDNIIYEMDGSFVADCYEQGGFRYEDEEEDDPKGKGKGKSKAVGGQGKGTMAKGRPGGGKMGSLSRAWRTGVLRRAMPYAIEL